MTTILWYNNRLYADTKMKKDGEFFHSLDKIRKLDKPLPYKSVRHNIDDMIYGYTWSGAAEPAKGFMDKLSSYEDHDIMFTAYEAALGLNLYSWANHFELIMIGAKSNYSVLWAEKEVRIKHYPHGSMWSMGAGGKHVFDTMDLGADPIRAMYDTFLNDGMSGGMIDVWEIYSGVIVDTGDEEEKTFRFDRVGICNELTRDQIRQLVGNIKDPYPLDFREKVWQVSRVFAKLGIRGPADLESVVQFMGRRRKVKDALAAKQKAATLDAGSKAPAPSVRKPRAVKPASPPPKHKSSTGAEKK